MAVVGLGANIGDSAQTLLEAWRTLANTPGVQTGRLSSPYRSQPVDMESRHWFVNAVGLVQTSLSPHAFLHALQAIETAFGRRRAPGAVGYQDRSLDLDLLLYDDITLALPELTLPHPRMHQRRFVLEPLVEIAALMELSPFVLSVQQWAIQCLAAVQDQPVRLCQWEGLGAF